MERTNLRGLWKEPLPEGYTLRTYRNGDESAWCTIVNESIEKGWTHSRFRKEIFDSPQFDPKGLFFVQCDNQLVATACAWQDSAEEYEIGVVHMVGVLSKYRGMKLGQLLTLELLHYFKNCGFNRAELKTEDFRLPAIRIYLNCGFKPVYLDRSHRAIWGKVYARLKIPSIPLIYNIFNIGKYFKFLFRKIVNYAKI